MIKELRKEIKQVPNYQNSSPKQIKAVCGTQLKEILRRYNNPAD